MIPNWSPSVGVHCWRINISRWLISQKRLGGLQAIRVPFFPDNTILITRLDNLSIYWQDGT
ncbi:Phage major capsid protein, P2 family [Sodalis glossinidius str. 'morsitans']|uniref:Phage major capsid protein, P2 family n=1 Tax=Sodalis glossinidius (strain morsitans) TaxID=343509 RepID=A0A193QLN6_SODGM|nr:Phage major capsid protein, P2 family [Sodalis glossinidius str. 'morsitans']